MKRVQTQSWLDPRYDLLRLTPSRSAHRVRDALDRKCGTLHLEVDRNLDALEVRRGAQDGHVPSGDAEARSDTACQARFRRGRLRLHRSQARIRDRERERSRDCLLAQHVGRDNGKAERRIVFLGL